MRIKWIDIAKGIAMICVIIGHTVGKVEGSIDLSFVYAFHLTVFFLLSGYTLKIQPITSKYANQKFKRLMKPYFYTCFAVLLMDLFNNIIFSKDGSIDSITYIVKKDIIRSFFASGSTTYFSDINIESRIGAIWFLPAMYFSLLFIQWTLNRFQEDWKRCVMIALISLVGYISSKYIWLPFSIQAGMASTVFILCGYFTKKYKVLGGFNWKHYFVFLLIFILGNHEGYARIYMVTNSYPDLLLSFIVALAGSLLIFKISYHLKSSFVLEFIGKHSMFYLCVHLFALETMGGYFSYITKILNITNILALRLIYLILHITFSTVITLAILLLQKEKNKISFKTSIISNDDYEYYIINIFKGILILLALIGYLNINSDLRRIIYSFHAAAFIFICGYFHKKEVKKSLKFFFLLYVVFFIADMLINVNNITVQSLEKYIFAMSFSKTLFSDIPSIGPIYYAFLILEIKCIYTFVSDYFIKKNKKIYIIMILSIIGFKLGEYGCWLPWSLDCALYGLIFYQVGVLLKKVDFLNYCSKHSIFYFAFSTIWAYMIYMSSMELATRKYTPFGLVIFGSMCGIFILYMLSYYIMKHMYFVTKYILAPIGKSCLYIFVVYSIFGKNIYKWISNYFNSDYIYNMILKIAAVVIIGLICEKYVTMFKKSFLQYKVKRNG